MDDPVKAIEAEIEAFVTHEVKDLEKALLAEPRDSTIAILRFHLLSEYLRERLSTSKLVRPDRLHERGNLTYHQKLCLVEAFDMLQDQCVQALRNVNAVRNQCSHEKDKVIQRSDIDRIGRPYGRQYTTMRREAKEDYHLLARVFVVAYHTLLSAVAKHELTEDLMKKYVKKAPG